MKRTTVLLLSTACAIVIIWAISIPWGFRLNLTSQTGFTVCDGVVAVGVIRAGSAPTGFHVYDNGNLTGRSWGFVLPEVFSNQAEAGVVIPLWAALLLLGGIAGARAAWFRRTARSRLPQSVGGPSPTRKRMTRAILVDRAG